MILKILFSWSDTIMGRQVTHITISTQWISNDITDNGRMNYWDDQAKTKSELPKLQIKPIFTIKIIYTKSYATTLIPVQSSKHFINSSAQWLC